MVWAGLLVSLISSLVTCFAELKTPQGVKRWSGPFIRRNRFTLALACLALLGFAVAGLSAIIDRKDTQLAQERLRQENNQIKSLMFSGKVVSPTISIIVQTHSSLLEGGASEQITWAE